MKRAGRAAIAVAALLAATELLTRSIATRDGDGQLRVAGRPIPPMAIPLDEIRANIAAWRRDPESFLAYDPATGWAPRPGARSLDGRATANGDGLRAEREVPRERDPAVLRVVLLGDSFTFGDELRPGDTWGAALERGLAGRGVPAEVLNLGVNAYGLDQAVLRWEALGRSFHPDVVVLGLQAENAVRALNVFRPLYMRNTSIPLSKPRFVLRGGALEPVNAPPMPPERIPAALADLDREPLAAHEGLLAEAYPRRWWMHSRLLALAAAVVGRGGTAPDLARIGAQPGTRALARALLERLAADVRGSGAALVVADLPMAAELRRRLAGLPSWDDPLLADATLVAPVVRALDTAAPLRDDDFMPLGHYGPRLAAIIGAALVEPTLRAACPDSPRGPAAACAALSRRSSRRSPRRRGTARRSPRAGRRGRPRERSRATGTRRHRRRTRRGR